jgi:preprotein translocase subunit SecG
MVAALLVLHILVCILLIIAVMIQGGENVDITAAFGGVSQAAFGPRGAVSTLARITWVLAAIFAATSITLSVWATKRSGRSVLETPGKTAPAQTSPAKPTPATPTPLAPAPFTPAPASPAPAKK